MYYIVLSQCVSCDNQDGFSYIYTTRTFVSSTNIFQDVFQRKQKWWIFSNSWKCFWKKKDGKDSALRSGRCRRGVITRPQHRGSIYTPSSSYLVWFSDWLKSQSEERTTCTTSLQLGAPPVCNFNLMHLWRSCKLVAHFKSLIQGSQSILSEWHQHQWLRQVFRFPTIIDF